MKRALASLVPVVVFVGVSASVASCQGDFTVVGSRSTAVPLEPGAAIAVPVYVTVSRRESTPTRVQVSATVGGGSVVAPFDVNVFLAFDDEREAEAQPPAASLDTTNGGDAVVTVDRGLPYCGADSCDIEATLFLTREDDGIEPITLDLTIGVVLSPSPDDSSGGRIDDILIDAPTDAN